MNDERSSSVDEIFHRRMTKRSDMPVSLRLHPRYHSVRQIVLTYDKGVRAAETAPGKLSTFPPRADIDFSLGHVQPSP